MRFGRLRPGGIAKPKTSGTPDSNRNSAMTSPVLGRRSRDHRSTHDRDAFDPVRCVMNPGSAGAQSPRLPALTLGRGRRSPVLSRPVNSPCAVETQNPGEVKIFFRNPRRSRRRRIECRFAPEETQRKGWVEGNQGDTLHVRAAARQTSGRTTAAAAASASASAVLRPQYRFHPPMAYPQRSRSAALLLDLGFRDRVIVRE